MAHKRALISVSNKERIVEFARALEGQGFEILSTGGTGRVLREAGINVVDVSDYTGFPEILDGRVKTLHPLVHGGLLYIRGNTAHEATVAEHHIQAIDMVVVDLYPEEIDIGGVTLLRAAAKNWVAVTVVTDPRDYAAVLKEIDEYGGTTEPTRKWLALKTFQKTAAYDADIAARHFGDQSLMLSAPKIQELRYGENPHQTAALYGNFGKYYTQLQGKELSYNNILDLTAAQGLIAEFQGELPAVAIIKHTNPSGVGQGETLKEAWGKAFATDTQAPFGGIVAVNVPIDVETARAIAEIFIEVIVAPGFDQEAREIFAAKKNVRLVEVHGNPSMQKREVRFVGAGSYLVQEPDSAVENEAEWRVVTARAPTAEEMRGLRFANRVAKHVKSNAIVFAQHDRTLGVGAGQMSRINSTHIATTKAAEAKLDLRGSALASDAFFPFPDGLLAALAVGATSVIQPGGSLKDDEVIKAANERGVAMIFTGKRHFRH